MEGDQILETGDVRLLVTGGRKKEGHGETGRRRRPAHLLLTRRRRNDGRIARNDEKERSGKEKRRSGRCVYPLALVLSCTYVHLKKKKAGAVPQWGKYGIISEIEYALPAPRRFTICSPKFSIFSKGPEFHTWLVEERKINPETVSKDQSKKEFVRFVEDFNTGQFLFVGSVLPDAHCTPATLPHEKYYNMGAYERRMSALRSGEFVPPSDDMYDPQADMKAISGAHKKKLVERESYMSREQLMELRKVQNERIEVSFVPWQINRLDDLCFRLGK